MRTDSMEKTEQTVYILNGITLLPHYTLPCFVAPGFTNYTPMKLWTANELLEEGAGESADEGGGHGGAECIACMTFGASKFGASKFAPLSEARMRA